MMRQPHHQAGFAIIALMMLMPMLLTKPVQADTVVALPKSECREIRHTLEKYVPIAPGFRQLNMKFPTNPEGIKGSLCRLVSVGTGIHMENEQVRTLQDLQAHIRAALKEEDWLETEQTQRFTGKSGHGRHVFAVTRNNAICVTTIQVSMIPGIDAPKAAFDNGTVFLGSLQPHQREWWVAVDCFHF